jgi:ATP-dependent 26S proteasome regulatory subunit
MESTATDDVGKLVWYAREVVREYLSLVSDEQPEDPNQMWGGFRISSQLVAKQFRENHPEILDAVSAKSRKHRVGVLAEWLNAPPENLSGLAELAVLFELTPEDVEIFIMAAAPALDPDVEQLYAYVRNDVHKRTADVGFACQVLSMGDQARFDELLRHCSFEEPLRRHRLVLLEPRSSENDFLDMNLPSRRMRAADRVLDFLRYQRSELAAPVDEALATVCMRHTEPVDIEDLGLPEFSKKSLIQLGRSRTLPVVITGPHGAGKMLVARALGGPLKRGVVSADLVALLQEPHYLLDIRLSELFREGRLGGDLVYLHGHSLPNEISGPARLVLERVLAGQELVLGTDSLPLWATELTTGWPVMSVPLPTSERRLKLWHTAFEDERSKPSDDSLVVISRRYQLSSGQVQQAAVEARRIAQIDRRRKVSLMDLDRACRAHFAHQLSELAVLIPPTTFKITDLLLPPGEKETFGEVLLYAQEREHIYEEWGFGERFPYGRGLSVLAYGPPGTGKTMSAMILAAELGLDLFRVDVSRILSRYVGETEKNLAKIFDEAERGRVMLLFDEADALFTKRTDVQSSVDRYANIEVAYLLQRMENFEGITLLTTNVVALIDEAFARRLRYRIYFPMPDEELRASLWRNLLPTSAPLTDNIAYDLLGKHFELAGGHIKQAVLRAAVYARRDKSMIGSKQLIEAAIAECREMGMLIGKLPKELQEAIDGDVLDQEPQNEARVVQ